MAAPFEAPPALFMGDFGVPVQFGLLQTTAIFDQPTEEVIGGMVLSTDYKITYPASDLYGLDAGALVIVAGVTYNVRRVRQIADGAFAEAYLSRV